MIPHYKNLLKELTLLTLFFIPIQNRVKTLYWALSDNNSFCNKKRYMNLGYWKNNPANLDEAGDQMALLLSDVARLNDQHIVLDVGFGFGDQDRYWLKHFNPKKIVGINVAPDQIKTATLTNQIENIDASRITYLEASATQIPFLDGSFDIVFSLEAPFHFNTREDFLQEAFRVLKPHGKLVLADIINIDSAKTIKNKIMQTLGCNFWQVPKANRYTMTTYQQILFNSGFTEINIESIWQEVYPHWLQYIKTVIDSPWIKEKFSPIFRYFLLTSLKAKPKNRQELMDYVLVQAIKPASLPA